MRVLSIDEIPEAFKNEISRSWLDRYVLFAEEISNAHFLLQDSSEKILDILIWLQGLNFPYKDLKIRKPTLPHWRYINRATHMWVLVEDMNNVIYLIEWILDMNLVPRELFDNMPDLII